MYHGWKFDGIGQCTERPAERDTVTAERPHRRLSACVEYCGLIFAYLVRRRPPPFELPRKDVFERIPTRSSTRAPKSGRATGSSSVENSMDAVHVSFVHQKGRVGTFVGNVSAGDPRARVRRDRGRDPANRDARSRQRARERLDVPELQPHFAARACTPAIRGSTSGTGTSRSTTSTPSASTSGRRRGRRPRTDRADAATTW